MAIFYTVDVNYDSQEYPKWEDRINGIGDPKSEWGDSGMGFGLRDHQFHYTDEEDAKATFDKLEELFKGQTFEFYVGMYEWDDEELDEDD
jgi:hypothetical protein